MGCYRTAQMRRPSTLCDWKSCTKRALPGRVRQCFGKPFPLVCRNNTTWSLSVQADPILSRSALSPELHRGCSLSEPRVTNGESQGQCCLLCFFLRETMVKLWLLDLATWKTFCNYNRSICHFFLSNHFSIILVLFLLEQQFQPGLHVRNHQGELFKASRAQMYPRPINKGSPVAGPRNWYLVKLPRWFCYAVRFENHYFKGVVSRLSKNQISGGKGCTTIGCT